MQSRSRAEVHAFVLMDNHYHRLLRCRRTDVNETLRWLQTSYSVRSNWAHRRRGHVFRGRFRSALIQDEGRLDTPWEGLVAGVVLGETRKAAKDPEKVRRVVAAARRVRPDRQEIMSTAESMRGRSWQEMRDGHGD